jgi:hypothetical protein
MSGGGFESLCLRRYLQVTLMGMGALRGGTITRTPECLQPLIAPPLASTTKLTRKLMTSHINSALIRWYLCVEILKNNFDHDLHHQKSQSEPTGT